MGIDPDPAGKMWVLFGLVSGSVAGFIFAVHYYYLVPRLAYQIISLLVGAVAGAVAFGLFYHACEKIRASFFSFAGPWRTSSVRLALLVLILSLLVSGPLSSWEGRGTEPVFFHLALALAVALGTAWLAMSDWSLPGVKGRVRRGAVPAVILAAVVTSSFFWVKENNKSRAASQSVSRVVLITMDTTRADYLSCYGYPQKTTPNLDALAERGARFTRAFCPMGITDPSHASIFTGAYPRSHGLLKNWRSITGEVGSLPEIFQRRGYKTEAIISRTHLFPSQLNLPGFSHTSGPTEWIRKTSAREAFRRAANFLVKNRDEKVFLWVHFFDPHKTYIPHPGYSEPFISENRGKRWGRHFLTKGKRYTEEEVNYHRGLYAGEVRYMDHWIGELLGFLDNLRPAPEKAPFVLATADHGEALGEYQDRDVRFGFGHGGLLLNAIMHVPLIISRPGEIPEGVVIDDVAESVDVAPTVAEYALGQKDFPAQGESLAPVIGKRRPTDDKAFLQREIITQKPEHPHLKGPGFAVVKGPYKLLTNEAGKPALYDLSSDFEESRDISGNEELVNEMFNELSSWKKRTPKAEDVKKEFTPAEKKSLKALGYLQ